MVKLLSSFPLSLELQLIATLLPISLNMVSMKPTTTSLDTRDRARAAADRAKLASQANSSIEPAAAAGANATGTTPTPPVPSADSAVKPHAPLPKAAAVVTPAVVVEDEVCPDTEYASVDNEDIGSDGRRAF